MVENFFKFRHFIFRNNLITAEPEKVPGQFLNGNAEIIGKKKTSNIRH